MDKKVSISSVYNDTWDLKQSKACYVFVTNIKQKNFKIQEMLISAKVFETEYKVTKYFQSWILILRQCLALKICRNDVGKLY